MTIPKVRFFRNMNLIVTQQSEKAQARFLFCIIDLDMTKTSKRGLQQGWKSTTNEVAVLYFSVTYERPPKRFIERSTHRQTCSNLAL